MEQLELAKQKVQLTDNQKELQRKMMYNYLAEYQGSDYSFEEIVREAVSIAWHCELGRDFVNEMKDLLI